MCLPCRPPRTIDKWSTEALWYVIDTTWQTSVKNGINNMIGWEENEMLCTSPDGFVEVCCWVDHITINRQHFLWNEIFIVCLSVNVFLCLFLCLSVCLSVSVSVQYFLLTQNSLKLHVSSKFASSMTLDSGSSCCCMNNRCYCTITGYRIGGMHLLIHWTIVLQRCIPQYIRLLYYRDASLNTLDFCITEMHPSIH